ncbi:MAG: hypothetical protein CMH49_02385 [Myxococcales bacterium]|nr:hypothetical protein [Myxococcales bacterium]
MVFQSTNTQLSKPYLQGQLLDDALLTDMISLIYQSRRQAKLNLEHSDQQFQRRYPISLYFMNGQVAYASSSNPYHRLGAILIRRGVISEFELSKVLSQLQGQKLGDALLQRELISREELIAALKDQALIILQSALLKAVNLEATEEILAPFDRFTVSHYDDDTLPLNLHIDAQGLLLEVFRQQDEVKSMLKLLPPLSECPLAQRRPLQGDRSEVAFALQQSGGKTPLKTLLFMNPIGALEALKLYHELLIQGDIKVESGWPRNINEHELNQTNSPQNRNSQDEWFDLCFTPEME